MHARLHENELSAQFVLVAYVLENYKEPIFLVPLSSLYTFWWSYENKYASTIAKSK